MSAGEQNQPPGESAIFTSAHMAEPPASRRRFYLYLLPILLFPVLLIATAFFVVPTDWFQQRADSTYLVNFGYATRLSGQDCPVLIYGDSTAMVGVDPRVITARTGLRACNIAEFEGMTLVTHTLLVDEFLAHNPRPRFLVFLYTPEDLSLPYDWSKVSTFEATSFLLRHERNLHTARVLAEHPGPTFGWAEQGLRMAAQRLRARPFAPEVSEIRARHDGQFPITAKTLPACDDVRRDVPPDLTWLKDLRSRYGVEGTSVLIYATPVAPCDKSLAYDQQHLDGVVDNTPYQPIPLDSYTEDGRLHANAAGARILSTMIADGIAAHLHPDQQAASAGGR